MRASHLTARTAGRSASAAPATIKVWQSPIDKAGKLYVTGAFAGTVGRGSRTISGATPLGAGTLLAFLRPDPPAKSDDEPL